MAHGKICYLEIPTTEVERSAAFYTAVFGWSTRLRGDGQRAFDDPTGGVSGSWVPGRPPARDPGMLPYIMVDRIGPTLDKVVAAGGTVLTPATSLGQLGEAYAVIADPTGNAIGLYQQPGS